MLRRAACRGWQRSFSSAPKLSLERQRSFVDVVRVFRELQAPTSDFTRLPANFVVPDAEPWPVAARGTTVVPFFMRAAYEAGTLAPEVVHELANLNFVWRQRDHLWQRNLAAFDQYRAINGHLDVPIDFTVAAEDEAWPKDLRGLPLGMVVHSLRQQALKDKLPQAKRAVLEEMGFAWRAQESLWERKLLALTTYNKVYGNLKVPRQFVVPVHDGWPRQVWHLRLGDIVAALRHHHARLPPAKKRALDALGFVWDYLEAEWARKLLALRTFKTLYGHTDVPHSFVVPEDDLEWPQEVWELELGCAVANLRTDDLSDDRKAALDDLGFAWRYRESEWLRKELALKRYRELFGDLDVPRNFLVPRDDKAWPERLWWMPLGQIVRQIRRSRRSGMLPDRVAALDAIGFEWTRRRRASKQL
ncbi:hypothetical protein ACHHYP_10271 [Achlya hypogyna]|uniref:Helicase-associated domain-containing protein n=1 Tax=Achlya hypogyna TaxID=1202772 RepID=A0A1V9YLT4_ACHHY|nr:hypothetical protein ACHHYP_10271 [Achlya hypogyna]